MVGLARQHLVGQETKQAPERFRIAKGVAFYDSFDFRGQRLWRYRPGLNRDQTLCSHRTRLYI